MRAKKITGWAEITDCLFCGKKLMKKRITQVFCNSKCQNNWYYKNDEKWRERIKKNSKISYNKYKDDPVYKKKRDLRTREWIEKNRIRFNALVVKNRKERLARKKNENTERG